MLILKARERWRAFTPDSRESHQCLASLSSFDYDVAFAAHGATMKLPSRKLNIVSSALCLFVFATVSECTHTTAGASRDQTEADFALMLPQEEADSPRYEQEARKAPSRDSRLELAQLVAIVQSDLRKGKQSNISDLLPKMLALAKEDDLRLDPEFQYTASGLIASVVRRK